MESDILQEPDKEEEKEVDEEKFVIANFKAGEFLAAVCDRQSYTREVVSSTDTHILRSIRKPNGFK